MEDASSPEKPPTFTLPDWGTEGAPTLPPESHEDAQVRVVRSEPRMGETRRPATLVGCGERPIEDAGLAEAARRAALDALAHADRQAQAGGAEGIEAVQISLTTSDGVVAALAYGVPAAGRGETPGT